MYNLLPEMENRLEIVQHTAAYFHSFNIKEMRMS